MLIVMLKTLLLPSESGKKLIFRRRRTEREEEAGTAPESTGWRRKKDFNSLIMIIKIFWRRYQAMQKLH